MRPMFLGLAGLAVSTTLAGCASTPRSDAPPADGVSFQGLAYAPTGPTENVSGQVREIDDGLEVTVDGATYRLEGATLFQDGAGIVTEGYTLPLEGGQQVAISQYLARYATAFVIESDVPDGDAFLYGGQRTPVGNMPAQGANYTGILRTGSQDGGHTTRNFTADADFAAGTMGFEFFVPSLSGRNGDGQAVIVDNTFSGTAQLDGFSSAPAQQGTLSGHFFGASGQEIAGQFDGRTTDGSGHAVGGVLIGKR